MTKIFLTAGKVANWSPIEVTSNEEFSTFSSCKISISNSKYSTINRIFFAAELEEYAIQEQIRDTL